MLDIVTKATRVAAGLLFPAQCALCGRMGDMLCAACADALPRAVHPRCHRCWLPQRYAKLCRHCAEHAPAFSELRAAYVMEDGARRLAHELKYEGMTALAEPMARRMLGELAPGDADLVVPVPLHRSRERARGYNQAAMLARQVARVTGIDADERAARRVRDTAPLVKTMHRAERLAIMAGAFEARRERVEGRRILLVDDVATTGATLDSCARALRAAGARDVRALTWARAD
ncbi:MAG TPA: ComF family protein [Dehalococcoidia bacterium]|nr:ComF family protein [Dehalococcoidia bacterium]